MRAGGIPRSGALQSLPYQSVKPTAPLIRHTFRNSADAPVKLPNLQLKGSYNGPAAHLMSPDIARGSQSVRFGGTPVKLVLDAKRELQPPMIPNANMALKNFGAFELNRFIDKRLTSLAN